MIRSIHGTLAIALLVTAACPGRVPEGLYRDPIAEMATSIDELEVQYLGVGGFLLRRGDHAILTAPFFSNPSLAQVVANLPIASDEERVRAELPPVDDVCGIVVGHAHYDHAMDLPEVARHTRPEAPILGSATLVHTLAPAIDRDRLWAMNDLAGDVTRPGSWVELPGCPIRVLPILSEHAPHFAGIKVMGGTYDEDLDALPTRAWGWVEGQTLAYLIDFLNPDGSVAHRVHYQDAASTAPHGLPAPSILEEHAVDVALITVAGYDQVDDYPARALEALTPRRVIGGHWEDFFAAPQADAHVVPGIDFGDFVEALEDALTPGSTWTLPDYKATVRLAPASSGTAYARR